MNKEFNGTAYTWVPDVDDDAIECLGCELWDDECSTIDCEGGGIFIEAEVEKTAKDCSCEEWEANVSKLNTCISMSRIHGIGYDDADPFKYCPWCGTKL